MFPRKYSDRLENWDLFVLRHKKTPNILVHIISFSLFWLSPVLAYIVSPWWLIGFFCSGFIGSAGHYLFNDGCVDVKEATSSMQVVYFSSLLVILFVSGKYQRHIQLANERFGLFQAGKMESVADPAMFTKLEVVK